MRVGAKHWVSLSRLIRDVLAQCFALSGMCWPNLMVGDRLRQWSGMDCPNALLQRGRSRFVDVGKVIGCGEVVVADLEAFVEVFV